MKTITDHKLSEIANDWAKEIPYENIGIRTAFAAGYRSAEKQANGVQSENGKLPIPHVVRHVCPTCNSDMDEIEGHYNHFCEKCNKTW